MPSLRRTISSPSVRATPYPSLSLSSASSPTTAAPGSTRGVASGYRRSSGSETIGRRVLADIEWWRVADGQRDQDTDPEQEDQNLNRDQGTGASGGLSIHEILDRAGLSSSVWGAEHHWAAPPIVTGSSAQTLPALPTDEFAALSISPYPPERRHHERDASFSSVDSTPEATPETFNGLRLSISDVDSTLPDIIHSHSIKEHDYTGRSRCPGDLFFDFATDLAGPYADFAMSPLTSPSLHFFN